MNQYLRFRFGLLWPTDKMPVNWRVVFPLLCFAVAASTSYLAVQYKRECDRQRIAEIRAIYAKNRAEVNLVTLLNGHSLNATGGFIQVEKQPFFFKD